MYQLFTVILLTNLKMTFSTKSDYDVKIEKFPFVCQIRIQDDMVYTGTIVAADWILTGGSKLRTKDIVGFAEIFAGFDNQDNFPDAQKKTLARAECSEIKKIKTVMCVMQVDSPFQLNEKVQIVTLAHTPWPQDERKLLRKCTVVGWELKSMKPKTVPRKTMVQVNRLKAAEVSAAHGTTTCRECLDYYDEQLQVCSSGEHAVWMQGLGGPLVCDNEQYGLSTDTTMCGIEMSNVFLYICPQLTWLRSSVRNVNEPPVSCKTSAISFQPTLIVSIIIFNKIMLNLF